MSKSVSELILNHLSDHKVEECLHLHLFMSSKIGLESLGVEIDRIQLPFTKVSDLDILFIGQLSPLGTMGPNWKTASPFFMKRSTMKILKKTSRLKTLPNMKN